MEKCGKNWGYYSKSCDKKNNILKKNVVNFLYQKRQFLKYIKKEKNQGNYSKKIGMFKKLDD